MKEIYNIINVTFDFFFLETNNALKALTYVYYNMSQ